MSDNIGMAYVTVDSCHSRWVFDTEQHRYRRALKGLGIGEHMATTEWRPYHGLDLDPDSESFVVVRNEAGTRMLRSWRHTGPLWPQCGVTGAEEGRCHHL